MIMTDWQEILDMDINLFTKLMKVPRIYDGRNCFKLNSIEKYKVYYLSIGRKTINNI